MKKTYFCFYLFLFSIFFAGHAFSEESPLSITHKLLSATYSDDGIIFDLEITVLSNTVGTISDIQLVMDANSIDPDFEIPLEGNNASFLELNYTETVQAILTISSPFIQVMDMAESSEVLWDVSYTDGTGTNQSTFTISVPATQ